MSYPPYIIMDFPFPLFGVKPFLAIFTIFSGRILIPFIPYLEKDNKTVNYTFFSFICRAYSDKIREYNICNRNKFQMNWKMRLDVL